MKKSLKIVLGLLIIVVLALAIYLVFYRNKTANLDFSKSLTSEEIVSFLETKRAKSFENIHYKVYKESENGRELVWELYQKGNKSYSINNIIESMPTILWNNGQKSIIVFPNEKRISVMTHVNKVDKNQLYFMDYEFVEKTVLDGKDVVVLKEHASGDGIESGSTIYVDIETGMELLSTESSSNGSNTNYYSEYEIGTVTNNDVKEIDYEKLYPDYQVDIFDK